MVNAMEGFNMPAHALISKNTALGLTIEYRWLVLSCGKAKMCVVIQLGNVKAVICVHSRDGYDKTLG